ncbi:MAG: hypothetical protein KIT69_05195 [Propionibacteriaceae bacterium]|nr:hypothetical protein [Propionibacteriaceae bacterium]
MSTLVMPRGSQAIRLPEQPAQSPDPTQAGAGHVSGVRTTAPPNPERLKQKPSTTMTTTTSPTPETTTESSFEETPTQARVDTTPVTTARTTRPRRMRAFLDVLTDDQFDLTALQREALLRLHRDEVWPTGPHLHEGEPA